MSVDRGRARREAERGAAVEYLLAIADGASFDDEMVINSRGAVLGPPPSHRR